MIKFTRHSFLFLCLFGNLLVYAQKNEDLKNSIIEQRIEIIVASLEEGVELDYTTLLEDLQAYYDQPLNLNTATIEQLRELYLLNDIQIVALQNHLLRFGALKSIYELQAVEQISLATIRQIEPFVMAGPAGMLDKVTFKNIWQEANSELMLRYKREFQQRAGYTTDARTGQKDYQGSPDYLYSRYRIQFRKALQLGFTMEKDPGESVKTGPDFTSAHVQYNDTRLVRKVIVGDYQAMFGQGLTFWNGLGFGKSPFILNTKKNALGFKPYTSVQEGQYMRGAAVALGYRNAVLSVFGSAKNMDASVQTDTTLNDTQDDGFLVSSINAAGLHRTQSEINKRGSLRESVIGCNLDVKGKRGSVGFTAAAIHYNSPLALNVDLYRLNRPVGQDFGTAGVNYQTVWRNANVFGEMSRSANGGWAAVNGVVASLHPAVALSLLHRHFSTDYQAMYANVFAENQDNPANERGLFMGIQTTWVRGWTFTAYMDLVKYPWLRYRVDAPSSATDFLVQLNYKPNRKDEFYVRFRRRGDAQNTSSTEMPITSPVALNRDVFRVNAAYYLHPNVQLKTRLEWVFYEKEGLAQSGYLMYQDVAFKKIGLPVQLVARYALFRTDDWNARVYAYENDVLYAFSIPAHSGIGSRMYAMASWDVRRGLELQVRYARWLYSDKNVIGTGAQEIKGNQLSDIHVMLRWRI
jgi:Helix-hairpin-helix motif